MRWQKVSGYHWRALVEADMSRFKRVIGGALGSRTDRRRATEVAAQLGANPGFPANAVAPSSRLMSDIILSAFSDLRALVAGPNRER